MATRFIPTVERESIDLVYVPLLFLMSTFTNNNLVRSSDRNVAGTRFPPLSMRLLIHQRSLE
jgi:hypothetical protein